MTTHEVRYQGRLMEHFTEEDARAYVKRRLEHPVEGPAFDPKDWTVGPRLPFELHSKGNLVDTFRTAKLAAKASAALTQEAQERLQRRGVSSPVDVASFFTVHDGPAERQAAADAALQAAQDKADADAAEVVDLEPGFVAEVLPPEV